MRNCGPRGRDTYRYALYSQFAGIRRFEACKAAGERLSPRADNPGEPENLALVELKRHVPEVASPAECTGLQHDALFRRCLTVLAIVFMV
jgi:hypothetical protein